MTEKRKFEVLKNGDVSCNNSCKVGDSYLELAYLDGVNNLCTAEGSPLINGGKIDGLTQDLSPRICRVCSVVKKEQRIFDVLPSGDVTCSIDCKVGKIRSHMITIDKDKDVCIADGTPLIGGGHNNENIPLVAGIFRPCATVTGLIEHTTLR